MDIWVVGYFLQLGSLNTHFNSLLTALLYSKSWKGKHLLSQTPLQVRWPGHLFLANETDGSSGGCLPAFLLSAGGTAQSVEVTADQSRKRTSPSESPVNPGRPPSYDGRQIDPLFEPLTNQSTKDSLGYFFKINS